MKIRYDRVHDGSRIFNNSETTMTVQDRWTLLGRSVFKLHNNLLLLETFAIMNYCAFSKILKKHDKKTGYRTKMAFMRNVVSKSSIATYPDVLDMIQRCEGLYDQAAKNIGCKEKPNLREDEQLFISTVRKLHTQDLATADDVVLDKRSYTRMLPTEIPPIRTEITGTGTGGGIETLLDDLLKAKEKVGGTVCEGSIVSEASLVEDINGSKNDGLSTSDTENRYRKHRFYPPDFCRRLKKQRCC
uniref:SPX domain-containing protein n=1 Tax=Pseudo-nitzschia australis TaxID=44445 RepID=A0A7S4AXK0_9STRA|mmetsp:Transcript_27694/g.60980  ORF Transcript_27694/g.60980 Transcript_27694/m.60980 type:complete len:244 (-) Transcript_27694:99-830(-)